MLWLLLLALAIVALLLIVAASRRRDQPTAEADDPPARASTASDDGVVPLPDGGWLLTPGWTFTLSIRGVGRGVALGVKRLLDGNLAAPLSNVYAPLARIVFEKGLRVDQVEDYFRENGPKYREELQRLTAGEDHDFIEDDRRRMALKVLDVWLPEEPWPLFEEVEPLTGPDLEAIARYGHDVLEVCLRGSAESGQVEAMNADDRRVPVFKRLVAEGLAEAHASIPPRDLLSALRLDELRRMLKVAGGPPVKRKADAVAFLQDRPDLRRLLEDSGCTRHFFRALRPGGKFGEADLVRIGRHLPRAWATAQLLADTYFTSYYATRNASEWASSGGAVTGVEVLTARDDVVCPLCSRMAQRGRLALGDASPPFHLGCRCTTLLVGPSTLRPSEEASGENSGPVLDEPFVRDETSADDEPLQSLLRPVYEAEGKPSAEVRKAVERVIAECGERGQWWEMRDAATSLARAGHRDLAWGLLNAALQVCWKLGRGNTGSIYQRMGAICKSEKRYATAAQQYLLACCDSLAGGPTNHAAEQLRICLKKAGLGEKAADLRDALLARIKTAPSSTLLQELRQALKDVEEGE